MGKSGLKTTELGATGILGLGPIVAAAMGYIPKEQMGTALICGCVLGSVYILVRGIGKILKS